MARTFLVVALIFSSAAGGSFVAWLIKLAVDHASVIAMAAKDDPLLFSAVGLGVGALVTFVIGAVLAQYPRWR